METTVLIFKQGICHNFHLQSQKIRIKVAKEKNASFGFVERTKITNEWDGNCPHYKSSIKKYQYGYYFICYRCGIKSQKPIEPYQKEFKRLPNSDWFYANYMKQL